MRLEEALFTQALKCPPAELAAFLERECGGDVNLRRRLEALIEIHHEPDALPEAPFELARPEPAQESEREDRLLGRTIGRYTLREKIGEGGSGMVYAAEQTEPVRRRVALKLIKPGMDSKAVIARFEAERQALALMDHPNIARVLDGGTTEEGRPYFVMELVAGMKITQHCDHHRLSTADRLNLFSSVCQAVQHAHLKGIIHRDLKPSNVFVTMVDGKPVPKVIDFGIAKAIGTEKLTDKTIFTALDQFIGTPAYMSPEQAERREQAIDTRTDIYSLGVLLYELLTGRTPFDTKALMDAGIEKMLRTIREQEPQRPSTHLSTLDDVTLTSVARVRQCEPHRLIQAVRGDLDWIVIKCLEKERARRYVSAAELTEDIQRFLGNNPIRARPPSVGYRLTKFVRRNRTPLATAGILLLILVASGAVVFWQARRAREAEQMADAIRFARPEVARSSGRTNFVTTLADPGAGSLRQVIREAGPGDCIRFVPELSGRTIVLTQGVISLDKSLILDASNLRQPVIISGNKTFRIFNVPANRVIELRSLVMTEGSGAAITTGGMLTMKDCVVSASRGSYGGGIFQDDGVLTLDSCLIVSNTASLEGAGLFVTSAHNGRAVANNRTAIRLYNTTIAHNVAEGGQGGGMKTFCGSLQIVNCTIAANSATTHGGGLRAYGALFVMTNSIICGNSGAVFEDRDLSLEGTHLGGESNLVSTDAQLLSLGQYGGSTMTMPPAPYSPAVDKGADSVTNFLSLDQRGYPRSIGAHVDIGAAEFRAVEFPDSTVVELLGLVSNSVETGGLFATHTPGAFDQRTAILGRLLQAGEWQTAEVVLGVNYSDLSLPDSTGDREMFRAQLRRFVEGSAQAGHTNMNSNWRQKLEWFDVPFAMDLPALAPLDFNGRIGRFKEARSFATNTIDDSFEGGRELMKQAAIWLQAGDIVTYSNTCTELIERYRESQNLAVIRRLAKTCLIMPLSSEVIQLAGEMADYAAAPEQITEMYRLSALYGKCMADYRRGNFASALQYSQELLELAANETDPSVDKARVVATANLLAAMSHKKLGHDVKAQMDFDTGQFGFESVWSRVGRQDLGLEWHEVLILRVLYREACEVMAPTRRPKFGTKLTSARGGAELEAATFVVSNSGDSGPGTLRQVVADAPAGAIINFAPRLAGESIPLTSGPIVIAKTLTIDGSTLRKAVRLDGDGRSQIFVVRPAASVKLDSLLITNGFSSTDGGGIVNEGALELNDCTLVGNRATGGGGAVLNGDRKEAHLTLINCTIAGNTANYGAGILQLSGTLDLSHSTITANDGIAGTGGVVLNGGPATIANCILAGNTNRVQTYDGDLGGRNGQVTLAGRNLLGQPTEAYRFAAGKPNPAGQFIGTAEVPLSPQLSPLGDYGGPTPTMPPQPNSLAVDNADDAVARNLRSDQRGFRRKVGVHADIGAFELQ